MKILNNYVSTRSVACIIRYVYLSNLTCKVLIKLYNSSYSSTETRYLIRTRQGINQSLKQSHVPRRSGARWEGLRVTSN